MLSTISVPFGAFLVPRILQTYSIPHSESTTFLTTSAISQKFSINPSKLTNTLFALTTTTQLIGAITETIVPFIVQLISAKLNDAKIDRGEKTSNTSLLDNPNEADYLQRIRKEVVYLQNMFAILISFIGSSTTIQHICGLRRNDSASQCVSSRFCAEYTDRGWQFGYVSLWSVVWPLVPFTAIINNFFELRGDAFKICVNSRRPVPQRAESSAQSLSTPTTILNQLK